MKLVRPRSPTRRVSACLGAVFLVLHRWTGHSGNLAVQFEGRCCVARERRCEGGARGWICGFRVVLWYSLSRAGY